MRLDQFKSFTDNGFARFTHNACVELRRFFRTLSGGICLEDCVSVFIDRLKVEIEVTGQILAVRQEIAQIKGDLGHLLHFNPHTKLECCRASQRSPGIARWFAEQCPF